jgi:DNA topoisomerase III
VREKRTIRSTRKGRDLIEALPESVSTPDMTAVWEATLEQIRSGEGDPREFLAQLQNQIRQLVSDPGADQAKTDQRPGSGVHCPKCRAPMREREGKFGAFQACTRFPDCNGTRPIDDTSPGDGSGDRPVPCPHCFSPLVRRKSAKGWFWGCSNFPACRQTVNDVDGRPAVRLPNTT